MLYQHTAARFRPRAIGAGTPDARTGIARNAAGRVVARRVAVGTLLAGAVFTALNGARGLWRLEGWQNRVVGAARVTWTTDAAGRPVRQHHDAVMRGGHLAVLRDLRTGALRVLADHYLRHADDEGDTIPPTEARGSFARLVAAEAAISAGGAGAVTEGGAPLVVLRAA